MIDRELLDNPAPVVVSIGLRHNNAHWDLYAQYRGLNYTYATVVQASNDRN